MFTARQLSGSASANSVMVRLLTVLMSLAIVGPNIFFSMSSIYTARVEELYLYDIFSHVITQGYDDGVIDEMSDTLAEEYTKTISRYVEIENYAVFYIYETYDEQENVADDVISYAFLVAQVESSFVSGAESAEYVFC